MIIMKSLPLGNEKRTRFFLAPNRLPLKVSNGISTTEGEQSIVQSRKASELSKIFRPVHKLVPTVTSHNLLAKP